MVVTHVHLDHSNDVNILIDAMTGGGLHKKGVLFAPDECLRGKNRIVLPYLRSFPRKIVTLKERGRYRLGSLSFSASARHLHSAETYGISFTAGGGKVSFVSDTKYSPSLYESYRGSDILVINVLRHSPMEFGDILHLSLEDAKKLITLIRPKKAVLTHLGMTMVKARPALLARQMTRELGIEVIAASDGMKLPLP